MKLITHRKFKCSCGQPDCTAPMPSLRLLFKINRAAIRAHITDRISIRSGCRCEVGNKLDGGCPGSAHKLGLAADISTEGLTISELSDLYNALGRERFSVIGFGREFIHVDIRKIK